jgi:hypothetical protein
MLCRMKHLALLGLLVLPLSPALAEGQSSSDVEQGMSLLEQGAQMMMRGMMAEMEPSLNEMADAFAQAQPVLRDLVGMMKNLNDYHPPEMMPNGDIILRHKLPGEMAPAPEIEL